MLTAEDTYSPYFKTMGIDPGLNNLGIGKIIVDQPDKVLVSIDSLTIQSEKRRDLSGLDEEDYGTFLRKLLSLKIYFREELDRFKPDIIVSESPFFDRRKPGSFEYLVSIMLMLRTTVIEYNPNVPFFTTSPSEIKMWLGVAGQKGKEVVKEGFLVKPELVRLVGERINTMTDHEIDAVSAGCSWLSVHKYLRKEE